MKSGTPPTPSIRRSARRHPVSRRINHWVNVIAVVLLVMTGLNIFNAHPRLYWGDYGSVHDTAVLEISGANGRGEVRAGGRALETTGLLGWSNGNAVAFPAWATHPSARNLAAARNWHLFLAWVLIVNGIAFWLFSLAKRHIQRDLVPTARELARRALWHDVREHLALRFPKGADSNRYHVLQKLAYLSAVALLLPGLIVTGLGMSPGADAVAPWINELLGGRQSARTLHFALTWALIAFVIVHVAAVLLAGVGNQLRSMITGRWAYDDDGRVPGGPTTLAGDIK